MSADSIEVTPEMIAAARALHWNDQSPVCTDRFLANIYCAMEEARREQHKQKYAQLADNIAALQAGHPAPGEDGMKPGLESMSVLVDEPTNPEKP